MKNRAHHHGIACSPYEAMFGCPAKVGLKTSSPPDNLVIDTVEQLEELLNASINNNQNNQENEENILEDLDGNDNTNIANEDLENILIISKIKKIFVRREKVLR